MFALSAWLGLAGPGRVFEWKSFWHMPQARVTLLPRSPVGSKEATCSAPLPSCMWCSISRRMEKLNYAWLTRKLNKFSNKFTRKRASEIATHREREYAYASEREREVASARVCVCAVYANFICQRIFHEVPCLGRCRRRRRSHCLSCCCCCWRCI